MKFFILFGTLVFVFNTYAQLGSGLQQGYASVTAYSSKPEDIISITANQASLAGFSKTSALIYFEKAYMLETMNMVSALIALVTGKGNFGVCLDHFGSSLYQQSHVGISYAKKLGKSLSIAPKFNYQVAGNKKYSIIKGLTADLSLLFHLTENLHAGIQFINPGATLFKTGSEKLPVISVMGIGYQVSPMLGISCQLLKRERMTMGFQPGLFYQPIKGLIAKMGLSTNSSSWWLSAGWKFADFKIEILTAMHPQLGLTPAMTIQYLPKSAKK